MDEVDNSLLKLAKGTGMIFAGTVTYGLLIFTSKVMIARFYQVSEYGVFNLALVIFQVFVLLSMIGFHSSLPRQIAYFRERSPNKVYKVIHAVLTITFLSGILMGCLLYLLSEPLSQIFGDPQLTFLKILSISLPFATLNGILVSISRGFGRVEEQVYFQYLLFPSCFLILILVISFKFPFKFVFIAHVLAQVFTFGVLTFRLKRLVSFRFNSNFLIWREMLMFSVPLMFSSLLAYTLGWMDTLMLGYYRSSEIVGIYNSAVPVSTLIPIFLLSSAFLYSPLSSQLYARGKVEELRRFYQILTKWVFLVTFPLFWIIILFPEKIISTIFGSQFTLAALPLQILAVGYMTHTLLGLNGLSLVVIGKPKLNMYSDVFAFASNIALNVMLIPLYGITGAAIATTFSYILSNVFRSLWLYNMASIHPFNGKYLRLLFFSFTFIAAVKILNISSVAIGMLPGLILLIVAFPAIVFISKSIDQEDLKLVDAVESGLGLNLGCFKKIMERFM